MLFREQFELQAKENVRENPLLQLVTNSDFVGFSYDVKYQSISLVTNDFWKMEAHGVPHNSFLIASPFNKDSFINTQEIDKELILLRVISECKIPNEDLWLETRVDKIKSLKDLDLESQSNASLDFDKYSKSEMGFTGLQCRILGTFYEENGNLSFGADLENYYGTKSLYIYKPKSESLERIVNFIDPIRKQSIKGEIERLSDSQIKEKDINVTPEYEIGNIRYTSTNRMQSRNLPVKVTVNPFDFIARRTATFGMTRTGKSNTVKTLIHAIGKNCERYNIKLSQMVFDLNGEYAFPNVQDTSKDGEKGAIVNLIPNSVVYTINPKVLETDDVKQLRFNFFKNLNLAHEFIVSLLKVNNTSTAADIESFINMDISSWEEELKEHSTKTRAKIKFEFYKLLLNLIGCKDEKLTFEIPISKSAIDKTKSQINSRIREIGIQLDSEDTSRPAIARLEKELDALNQAITGLQELSTNLSKKLTAADFKAQVEVIGRVNHQYKIVSSSNSELLTEEIQTLLNMITRRNSNNQIYNGYINLAKLHVHHYHNANSKNYIDSILNDIINAKTIVLDISIGSQEMKEMITKKIVNKIFNYNLNKFTSGEHPPKVILYVEEAHNLIGKDMDLTDIWPRTAKEGAKYGIGLVYSTQEPSSINKNILSNTENWFVTHLNNEDEMKILSKYYDFGDFKESLLRAKDVGFARIKTMSQNFVVPVQIKKFEGGE